MKTAGIVCEYNPMHSGHLYQIEKTREILGEDAAIVCVMSGNYVQRGECAVMNKFARAKAAVLSGADLVIELPIPWNISTAERFAAGAVSILDRIGVCTHISFGSETGEIKALQDAAEKLLEPEMDKLIKLELEKGMSYPSARQTALKKLCGSRADIISQPNNILAVEYLKAILTQESKLIPIAVERIGAGHDSAESNEKTVSASYIREKLLSGEDIESEKKYLPESVYSVLCEEIAAGRAPVSFENSETAVLSKLRTMSSTDFSLLPDGSEGLYFRLYKAASEEPTIKDIIDKTKTKRYAYSRIKRMILFAYLGIRAADAQGLPPYARVLAIGKKGRELIKKMSEKSKVPVIVKPSAGRKLDEYGAKIFELGAKATDLYVLGYKNAGERRGGSEYTTTPFVLK